MAISKLLRTLPWRLRCILSSRSEITLFRLPNGGAILYPINSQIGYALFSQTFEKAELAFASQTLREGDTFIDIGANAGIFSVTAAKSVGTNGRVVAFEPGEFESSLFELNVRLNRLTNVELQKVGVSDKEGTSEFVISADGAMNSLRRTEHKNQQPVATIKIRTTTLEQVLSRPGMSRPRLIKLDTEGAERQILLPALPTLKQHRDTIVLFESYDANNRAFGYTAAQLIQELSRAGGIVSRLMPDGTTSPLRKEDPRGGPDSYNFVLQFA